MSRTIDVHRGPGLTRLLSVAAWSSTQTDPIAASMKQEREASPPGYQRVSLFRVNYFNGGADWEFTFTAADGPRHAIQLGFFTAPGKGYAIMWLTREFDWQANRTYFDLVAASFHPGA